MAGRNDPQGDQFFALRTFRKDGRPVSLPIWLAPGGDHWYGYTPGRSWKVKRIRRDPRIEVAPSTYDGEPRGDWRSGRARVVEDAELRPARRAMTAKYGYKFRFFELVLFLGRPRKRGGRAVGLEITFDSVAT